MVVLPAVYEEKAQRRLWMAGRVFWIFSTENASTSQEHGDLAPTWA
jgi:hypothetical protein